MKLLIAESPRTRSVGLIFLFFFLTLVLLEPVTQECALLVELWVGDGSVVVSFPRIFE